MSIKNMSLAVLSAATMVSAPSVFAQASAPESGLYLGAGVGQMKAKDACRGAGAGVSCDDKDTSYNLFVGYDFNRLFAAELGYVNFGEAKASGPGVSATFEPTAFEAVGVAKWPVWQNVSVYGKLGAFRWDVDARNASETGTDLTYGVGVRYSFTRNWAAQLEWRRYNDVGDSNRTGQSDIEVVGISALFKF